MTRSAAWIALIAAAGLDVAWALAMKRADGFRHLGWTLASLAALAGLVLLLGRSLQVLPVGAAYAVWTGLGAAGTVLLGAVLLGEALTPARLAWIGLIVAGVIGLRFQEG
jgi:quaternary ammonium compound-resistance protein SugE